MERDSAESHLIATETRALDSETMNRTASLCTAKAIAIAVLGKSVGENADENDEKINSSSHARTRQVPGPRKSNSDVDYDEDDEIFDDNVDLVSEPFSESISDNSHLTKKEILLLRSPIRGVLRAVSSITIHDIEALEKGISAFREQQTPSSSRKKLNSAALDGSSTFDASPSVPIRSPSCYNQSSSSHQRAVPSNNSPSTSSRGYASSPRKDLWGEDGTPKLMSVPFDNSGDSIESGGNSMRKDVQRHSTNKEYHTSAFETQFTMELDASNRTAYATNRTRRKSIDIVPNVPQRSASDRNLQDTNSDCSSRGDEDTHSSRRRSLDDDDSDLEGDDDSENDNSAEDNAEIEHLARMLAGMEPMSVGRESLIPLVRSRSIDSMPCVPRRPRHSNEHPHERIAAPMTPQIGHDLANDSNVASTMCASAPPQTQKGMEQFIAPLSPSGTRQDFIVSLDFLEQRRERGERMPKRRSSIDALPAPPQRSLELSMRSIDSPRRSSFDVLPSLPRRRFSRHDRDSQTMELDFQDFLDQRKKTRKKSSDLGDGLTKDLHDDDDSAQDADTEADQESKHSREGGAGRQRSVPRRKSSDQLPSLPRRRDRSLDSQSSGESNAREDKGSVTLTNALDRQSPVPTTADSIKQGKATPAGGKEASAIPLQSPEAGPDKSVATTALMSLSSSSPAAPDVVPNVPRRLESRMSDLETTDHSESISHITDFDSVTVTMPTVTSVTSLTNHFGVLADIESSTEFISDETRRSYDELPKLPIRDGSFVDLEDEEFAA